MWRERERKAGMRLTKPELRVRKLKTLLREKVVEGEGVVIVHKYARERERRGGERVGEGQLNRGTRPQSPREIGRAHV